MTTILKVKEAILLIGDMILLFSSLPITLAIAFLNDFSLELVYDHLPPFTLIYFFLVVLYYIAGLYETRSFRPATAILPSVLLIHAIGVVFGTTMFYLLNNPEITPKTNLLLNMAIAALFFWIWRVLFQRYVAGRFKINVAIAGLNEHAKELADFISAKPHMGYRLAAFISTAPLFDKTAAVCGDTTVLWADKDLIKNLIAARIDTVITAENPHFNPIIAQMFYESLPYKIRFLDLAQSYELLTARIPISYISQTWFLENINEQQKRVHDNIKRILDIAAASFILISTLPLWPIIAFAIKLESAGPVLYLQERVGRNKKLFRLIKFRSMIHKAEGNKPIWAQENDPRVTRVGAFLRRIHLDELPQMINILKGDLSLVGPRPERTEFVRELEAQIPHYHIRHIIKPGFTGWAQVNFRYARTPMDTYEKFQYDLYYLKNRSALLDVTILLKTINLFFKKTQ